MADLLDIVSGRLGSGTVEQLSKAVGADTSETRQAIGAALPVLLGALAKNTRSEEGAESLARALERDHDGSVLENLSGLLGTGGGLEALFGGEKGSGGLGGLLGAAGSLLGGGRKPQASKALDGAGILGHLLGGRQPAVEDGIGRASGLDAAKVGKLLVALAPIVMGALGKMKQEKNLDAQALAGVLDGERASLERRMPQTPGGGLVALLDRDDDGSIADELAQLGGSALGAIFGK